MTTKTDNDDTLEYWQKRITDESGDVLGTLVNEHGGWLGLSDTIELLCEEIVRLRGLLPRT